MHSARVCANNQPYGHTYPECAAAYRAVIELFGPDTGIALDFVAWVRRQRQKDKPHREQMEHAFRGLATLPDSKCRWALAREAVSFVYWGQMRSNGTE